MRVEVNGARLWFEVDGAAFVPDGARMRARPTVVLIHGGPASYDHSYLRAHFAPLAAVAQVVYLDLRGHGRSSRENVDAWSFEQCADDIAAFCDALEVDRPVVFGHSMGGWVVALYGARHPGHARSLILQSTAARWDMGRFSAAVERVAGPDIAELARRNFAGEPVTDDEWARVYASAYGPNVPDAAELARRVQNPDLGRRGLKLLRELDIVAELRRITSPTLVCVGDRDGITPIAAARELVNGLSPGIGRLEILEGAGHFAWLDMPDRYFRVLTSWLARLAG